MQDRLLLQLARLRPQEHLPLLALPRHLLHHPQHPAHLAQGIMLPLAALLVLAAEPLMPKPPVRCSTR